MKQPKVWRQGHAPQTPYFAAKAPRFACLQWRYSPFSGYTMRMIPLIPAGMFLAGMALFATATAWADSRVFIVANQADGYGIDQCLAQGERCGAHAAHSYCRSRDFAQATAYRRVKPEEMTDSISKSTGSCRHGGCSEYVAITCQR